MIQRGNREGFALVPNRRLGTEGFTLVELLIVIAIIGVLGSVATFGVTRYLEDAKKKAASTELNTLSQGVLGYQAANSKWPQKLKDIAEYVKKQGSKDPFVDPWGSEYKYVIPGKRSGKIISWGPDCESGTEDDIEVEIK